jgi:hypothetical protein
LGICKKAADHIATLAVDLQLQLQCGENRAAVKFVLKQKTIDAMLKKFDRSKLDLQLAYTIFSDVCRRQEHDLIKQYMSEE